MSSAALPKNADQLARQESLEAAFAFFNETSAQLANSYKALESKVQQLSLELDTSEAKRFEENKRNTALEQRMQALLDFLPGGVIVLNSRGVIVESNPAAESLLATKLEGKVWRHVIAETFAPKNDDGLEISTRSGKRLSISTSSLGAEGQILLLTDQTQTRQLQDEVNRTERLSAMGKMVSALAHQIRTPLSAAILYAGHLSDSAIDEDTQKKFAGKCLSRLRHMEKQVRDMMLFVKHELPLNDVVSVKELEKELHDAAEVALQRAPQCEFTWLNEAPDLKIKCHREALVSSLMNLINNAIQSSASPVAASITLRAGKENPSQLCITVQDNGDGMDEATLARVQEMFTTTKSHGTGLGLAVVKAVARAHGATFTLSSEHGVGTNASLCIPTVENASSSLSGSIVKSKLIPSSSHNSDSEKS